MLLSDQNNKRLERASNITIVVIAVCVAAVFIRNHLITRDGPAVRRPAIGEQLAISGEPFSSYKNTLCIALRPGCQYCAASSPFYQQLVKDAAEKDPDMHVLVALPPGSDRNYVKSLALPITDVRTLGFESLRINSTPTLLILDSHGRVTHVWVGQLSDKEEVEVRRAVGLNQARKAIFQRGSENRLVGANRAFENMRPHE